MYIAVYAIGFGIAAGSAGRGASALFSGTADRYGLCPHAIADHQFGGSASSGGWLERYRNRAVGSGQERGFAG